MTLRLLGATLLVATFHDSGCAQGLEAQVTTEWNKSLSTAKTHMSVQVCVEAPLRRGSKIHDQLFSALKDLNVSYARLQPWYPYPHLAVAELEPPADGQTAWDFTLMDQIMADFMSATATRPVVMNISTIPQWMFKTAVPVKYPPDPDQIHWEYEQGTELRDPAGKEVADYFARVASWYIKGSFKDEYGREHRASHRYRFEYWEVLNEPDWEHHMSAKQYTALYDAIVEAVRKVDPQMKFMGPGMASASYFDPRWVSYFLDPKNHKPGIPIHAFSFHFYASPGANEPPEVQQYTFFNQVDEHAKVVRYIAELRRLLSPETLLAINEAGAIPFAWVDLNTPSLGVKIPPGYWNLSAAVFAYFYATIARLDVDMIHAAELIDYPGQAPGANLVDWDTGKPKPAYQVLKLLADHIQPGDELVDTHVKFFVPDQLTEPPPRDFLYAQGFTTKNLRKLLLINKRMRDVKVKLPGLAGSSVAVVDESTGSGPAAVTRLSGEILVLARFAVALVTLPTPAEH